MKKGIGTIAIIIVVAVFVALITGTYFFVFKKDSGISAPIKVSLEDALKNSLGVDEVDTIVISNRTETHVRGTYSAEGDVKDFYAVNNGSSWKIFQIEGGKISCQRARALGFPEIFITDCENTHPSSKTAKEVADSSQSGDDVTIVGVINIPNDPSSGITISSGGGEISVSNIDSNNSNISNGDVVVISGTVSEESDENTTDSSDTSAESSSSNKKVIAETVDGFYDEITDDGSNDSDGTINEPQTTELTDEDIELNPLDRDYSGEGVLITP